MELRDFAERILFATTLEEKLVRPEIITDERPGDAMPSPEAPGRPAALHFKAQGSGKADFPGLHRLDDETERGRVLHFFANHELLATELMALVLLRFPDAPAAFRRGVLKTLQDEQDHVRLYLDRMAACGVTFGELPVSGYFWRSVAPMESPMDFVAALSLTFEQANLDFARMFGRGFAQAGDTDTAALLEHIYRDEIGHVAHGLKWFRRWKNPSESDWDAFCRQLKFPLSPQRAKGVALNVEGRKAAGLDDAFIANLDIYSRSKGRTPTVFVFNPLAEGFIAYGPHFTPVKHQAALVADLAHLPQFLCRKDDVVLVPKMPAPEFLAGLKRVGFELPEFAVMEPGGAVPELADRKLGGFRPWAWAPDSVRTLAPLEAQITAPHRSMRACFHERIAALYSKAWSAEFLRTLLPELRASVPELPICTDTDVGVAVTSLDAALAAIAAIRARGHHRVVVKQALGLAGGNAIRLWEPELLDTQRRWMADAFEAGRTLVVEPWLEREADFSAQYEMTGNRLHLVGFTDLYNDQRGQFTANGAAPGFARKPSARICGAFPHVPDSGGKLTRVFEIIRARLESVLSDAGHTGPVGIDAFVHRSADGPRLKPVVEINPRYTMGRLLLELMRRAAPGTHGLFRLVNRATLKAEGCADFAEYAGKISNQYSVKMVGEPVPKIAEGAVCLNDPASAQVCLGVFRVGNHAEAVRAG
jgi:uncharacterized ferritin-like protein (DUF455 family)